MNNNTDKKLCKIEGCESVVSSRGWCSKHYQRWRHHGCPMKLKPPKKDRGCMVVGCKRKHHAKGYCGPHHHRLRRYGDPLGGGSERGKYVKCIVEGCNSNHYGNGYCIKHNARYKAHGNPLTLIKDPNRKCSVGGCNRKHAALGYCQRHYELFRRNGKPERVLLKCCSVKGCEGKHFGKGYCKFHYYKSDHYKEIQHRRRARINKSPINDFTSDNWEKCLLYFNSQCAYCGESGVELHQEHVIPIIKGGSNTKTNIVPSCPDCNWSKRTKTLEDWYPKQSFYDRKREEKIYKWMNYKIKNNKIQLQLF